MSFDNEIKRHLSAYKKMCFENYRHGIWQNNPENVLKYAFIPEEADNNLLPPYKDKFLYYEEILKKQKKNISRHMYFHHMNSSQAMCINFFFPLLEEHQLELITMYLGFPEEKIKYETVAFERKSTIDSANSHRPTSFDFYFETTSDKKFYFEIKYTERDFGKAPMDEDHIKKFNNVYINHLGPTINQKYHDMNEFLNNYQLMRNLIHIGDKSYVVLIYPNGNKKVTQQAEMARNEIVGDQFKPHLFTVEWEDILDSVFSKIQHPEIKTQFDEFGRKYIIDL